MIRFRVHESLGIAGKRYDQSAFRATGKCETKRRAIKLPGFLNVTHGKTAERLACVKNDVSP